MIKLSDLVGADGIYMDIEAASNLEALEQITQRMVRADMITPEDRVRLFQVFTERENLCSTAVGLGAAIPHAYYDRLDQTRVLIARLAHPVDYCSPDEKPVDLIFLLVGPKRVDARHLQILSKIVRMIKDQQFDQELRAAQNPADVLAAVAAVEERHH